MVIELLTGSSAPEERAGSMRMFKMRKQWVPLQRRGVSSGRKDDWELIGQKIVCDGGGVSVCGHVRCEFSSTGWEGNEVSRN